MKNLTKLLFLPLHLALFTNFSYADTAVAKTGHGDFYRASRSTIKEASSAVLKYCEHDSRAKCTLIFQSKPDAAGYGAIATSKTETGFSASYATEAQAKQAALDACAKDTPSTDTCSIVLSFLDSTHAVSREPSCHEEMVEVPYDIYENQCEYNDFGPVNCQNVPTHTTTTEWQTICD